MQLELGRLARVDAELLLAHTLGVSRTRLHGFPETLITSPQQTLFAELCERRERGEPVAYLLGQRSFHAIDLRVDARVLIPRADTETLVELALLHLPAARTLRVLDLGCGSGAIGLALKIARPLIELTLADLSSAALQVAAGNAARLGVQARIVQGRWLEPFDSEQFDVIVSNPPYLGELDPHLSEGDLRFEPRGALVAGPSGLECYHAILNNVRAHLAPGALLAFEHGAEQAAAVRAALTHAGFAEALTLKDLAGLDRVSYAFD